MNFLKIILRECIFTSGWVDLAGRVYYKCLNCWDLINFKKKQSFFFRLRITNLQQIHFTILRLIYLKSFFYYLSSFSRISILMSQMYRVQNYPFKIKFFLASEKSWISKIVNIP